MRKNRLILPVLFLGLLFFSDPVSAKQKIQWSPEHLVQIMGTGLGETEDLAVTFTSEADLKNVDVWVVPELRPFVRVTPDHFDTIDAKTSYLLNIHFTLPQGTPPLDYSGTVHFRVGKRTYPQPLKITIRVDYDDNYISPLTKVLTDSSLQYLTSISEDGSELIFSEMTEELESLLPGDILAIGITGDCPHGLLRRIETITESNGSTHASRSLPHKLGLECAIASASHLRLLRTTPSQKPLATA
jgi:hypothetical protein